MSDNNDKLYTEHLYELYSNNDLTADEYQHLSKLATAAEKKLAGEGLDKEASRFGKVLDRAWQGAQKDPLKALLATGLIAGVAGAPLKRGYNAIADPIRENSRYKRMKELPGPLELEPRMIDRLYIAEDEEDREEKALRKAFSILHKTSPEITAVPELAKAMILQDSASSPLDLVSHARSMADNLLSPQQARANIGRAEAAVYDDSVKRLRMLADQDLGLMKGASADENMPIDIFAKTTLGKVAGSQIPVYGGGAQGSGARIPDQHGVSELSSSYRPFVPFDQSQKEKVQAKHEELYRQENPEAEQVPQLDMQNIEQSATNTLGGNTALELFSFVREMAEESGGLKERVQQQEEQLAQVSEDAAQSAASAKVQALAQQADSIQQSLEQAKQEALASTPAAGEEQPEAEQGEVATDPAEEEQVAETPSEEEVVEQAPVEEEAPQQGEGEAVEGDGVADDPTVDASVADEGATLGQRPLDAPQEEEEKEEEEEEEEGEEEEKEAGFSPKAKSAVGAGVLGAGIGAGLYGLNRAAKKSLAKQKANAPSPSSLSYKDLGRKPLSQDKINRSFDSAFKGYNAQNADDLDFMERIMKLEDGLGHRIPDEITDNSSPSHVYNAVNRFHGHKPEANPFSSDTPQHSVGLFKHKK